VSGLTADRDWYPVSFELRLRGGRPEGERLPIVTAPVVRIARVTGAQVGDVHMYHITVEGERVECEGRIVRMDGCTMDVEMGPR
jgi:hypothetical protein